jgi:hypothetical protein
VRLAAARSALAALLVTIAVAPSAGASPASDAAAVFKDFSGDRDITACLFTLSQLQNALSQITPDVNAYSPGFRAEVDVEIARWRAGSCAARTSSAGIAALRIVKVQPKGGARSEYVIIRNTGRKAIKLKGYALRDAADHTIKFKKTTLKAGRSLRVVTGCRKGSRRAVRKGARYYACRTKQIWNDAGDIVELVSPKGGLLSRKAYGTPPPPPAP